MEVNFKVGQRYQLTNGNVVTVLHIFKDGSARVRCKGNSIIIRPDDVTKPADEDER